MREEEAYIAAHVREELKTNLTEMYQRSPYCMSMKPSQDTSVCPKEKPS